MVKVRSQNVNGAKAASCSSLLARKEALKSAKKTTDDCTRPSQRFSTGKPGCSITGDYTQNPPLLVDGCDGDATDIPACETMIGCELWSSLRGSAPMRKIRYAVAMSLDGYIAGPNGEYDWIGTDSEVDFTAFWKQFDTLLIGRRTFELAVQTRGDAAFTAFTGITSLVFSRTLKQQNHPHVTVMSELNADWVRDLKAQSGKDIWLFGGSSLFRSFFDSGLIDGVEVTVIPVLLGAGIPLFPPPYSPTKLRLVSHHLYRSGRVSLIYEFPR